MEKERRINNINTENKYVIKISNMNQKLNFKKKVKLNKKMLHPEFNFSSIESSTKKRKTYQPAYISSNQSNILEGSECSSNYDTNTPMYKLKKMNVRKLSNNSISLLSDQSKKIKFSLNCFLLYMIKAKIHISNEFYISIKLFAERYNLIAFIFYFQ